MKLIQLEAIPNQKFSLVLDGTRYILWFRAAGSIMAVTITKNDVEIVSGRRCVAGSPLIPFEYLEAGNFVFQTQNYELPWWENFGVTQSLIYVTQTEIETYRSGASASGAAA